MNKNIYTVRDLCFTYNNSTVLSIKSLDFIQGKIQVLLGPNGSGKTTLLKLLNRLLPLQSGEITFDGKRIDKDSSFRSKTVYVHQNPMLLSGTVFDNIAYGLKLRGYSRQEIEAQVAKTLSVVGLEGFAHRKSTALSGGEIQRVAVARAMAFNPAVLLLDEPTSSVDRENVGRIESLLLRIKKTYGCTIIISTHNLPFAYRICDRLIHLEEGKVKPTEENILKGRTVKTDSPFLEFQTESAHSVFCPLIEGSFSKAVIGYDRILLSGKPFKSSARNSFRGRVEKITASPHGEKMTDVKMRILHCNGESSMTLVTRITEPAVEEFSIQEGRALWLSFKASSVYLY